MTINDTNISELSEKNGYKRIPKRIITSFDDSTENYILNSSHDGYSNNFNLNSVAMLLNELPLIIFSAILLFNSVK